MAKFKIVVDYGKPYDIGVNNETELRKELKKLGKLHDRLDKKGELPYFDVWIYDENDKDITDKVFKKFKIGED